MNNVKFNSWIILVISMAVVGLTWITGCSAPGMTSKEVNQRHINTMSTNWLMIQDDIDKALLLEKPTRLTDFVVR